MQNTEFGSVLCVFCSFEYCFSIIHFGFDKRNHLISGQTKLKQKREKKEETKNRTVYKTDKEFLSLHSKQKREWKVDEEEQNENPK